MNIKKLVKATAGTKKVSAKAVEEINKYIEDQVKKLTEKASNMAGHAGRKVIREDDVRLALK